jgi:hypothetical protein
MNKYNDLELSILSCLLQEPKLMDKVILEDEHFIKHKKIWLFMKSFYKKFGNFDLTLMVNISKNKYRMVEYILWIVEKEPAPSLFEYYQKQLIEEYNQKKQDKWVIEKIYELSNDLLIGNVELKDYKNKVDNIFKNAKEIFK